MNNQRGMRKTGEMALHDKWVYSLAVTLILFFTATSWWREALIADSFWSLITILANKVDPAVKTNVGLI